MGPFIAVAIWLIDHPLVVARSLMPSDSLTYRHPVIGQLEGSYRSVSFVIRGVRLFSRQVVECHFSNAQLTQFFLREASTNKNARNVTPLRARYVRVSCFASQYHCTQVPPFHRAHLRTWRLVVLATQTPLTRVRPAPHAAMTCVMMPSGS